MAFFTVQEMIEAASEATKLENDRIKELIEGERLVDDTGEPEDVVYNKALDDVLAAMRAAG